MITADTSVLIAMLRPGHEFHRLARSALRGDEVRLVAHTAAETFSELTGRRPRVAPRTALSVLRAIDREPLTLSARGYLGTLERCVDCGVVGGAVYDALIAATAQEAGARLVSLDHRAAPTYAAIGVDFQLLQP
ncbi:MAG: PIN domain-containing protein [Candidatus Dormibacteraeota bacterium]|nr:PIN domain-containing protein [Candidatus Dormibacteraeota bacterium]MBO0746407.1 PIN domain-containing protein [Candidatus Dormibacteraeota bacterium]